MPNLGSRILNSLRETCVLLPYFCLWASSASRSLRSLVDLQLITAIMDFLHQQMVRHHLFFTYLNHHNDGLS